MRKRTTITEADKLKEARSKAAHFSRLTDSIIAGGQESFDKSIFASCIDSWISSTRLVHRIEMDERLAKLKKEIEAIEREEYNKVMLG